MKQNNPYNAIVFSGGGCRCFWQVGFYEVLSEVYSFVPNVFAGVSAGATMACMIAANRIREGIRVFMEMARNNKKNLYIENMLNQKPLFPHHDMYLKALNNILDDQAFQAIKRSHVDIRILLTHPPECLGTFAGALIGFFAYSLEKILFEPLHPKFPILLGYRAKVISVKSCPNIKDLTDLLLQSSCTPPVIPFLERDGKPVFDGGLIDNVPARIINTSNQKVLVLLTRNYSPKKLQQVKNRTYVQPSRPIQIKKWDYTDPEGIQKTYDLGRRDAENFIKNKSLIVAPHY
jgi:predicted acylesterase/phospholipase RssA